MGTSSIVPPEKGPLEKAGKAVDDKINDIKR